LPLFRREPPGQRAAREALEAEQAASRESLARGGLPLHAQRRLAGLRSGGGAFTSDLSVNEFGLGKLAGLQPLSQVMGSSVYRVGWQPRPGNWSWWGGGTSQELGVLSEAWNQARRLAFGRLAQEGRAAGAHAVVGVHLTRGRHDWAADAIEYVAVGTAVRIDGLPVPEWPALTDLSAQDFWKLRSAGWDAVGVVGASTIFYIVPGWAQQRARSGLFGSGWVNQELGDFTRGLYDARRAALWRVHAEAQAVGAQGVVGVSIEQHQQEREVEQNNSTRIDLIVTFHVLGTAIVQRAAQPGDPAVRTVLDLRSVTTPGARR
jgi:uncharacterized protein YbjQ (UPF0145 family)